MQIVEPEALKLVLDDLMLDHNIDILLHTNAVGAKKSASNIITSVEIQERRGRRHIFAKSFVDCSGDCDLAYHCGASTRFGNHGPLNLGSLATRFGGLSSDVTPTAVSWRNAIMAAKHETPALRKIIPKNESVLIRLPMSGDVVTYLASASYDPRNSSSITAAERSGRNQAQEYLKVLRTLPGHEKMYLVSTGPNFGTRESRHINAMYQLTENDIMSSRRFDDVVALGAWAFEFHDETHESWASTFKYPPGGCFDVPLGCLRSVDTLNLFAAGRCVDGDQYAGSAVRVMGTALATGQAAGVAAGFAAMKAVDGGWDVKDVQACLRRNGAFLESESLPDGGPIDKAT
jgi:FAD dependent oxidoreductase